jgi:hypothetical protein
MVIASRFVSLLVVLAAIFSPLTAKAGVSTPPTPGQVVERYVHAVQGLVGRCQEMLGRTAQGAIAVVERLDENGAPNEAIIAAGRLGVERVNRQTAYCLGGLHRLTEGAVRILHHLGAPEEAFMAVRRAAEAAAGAIREGSERAKMAVRAAVEAAISE